MEKRLQTIDGDTVLEITHEEPKKTRLSENNLLATKARLEASIANFQTALNGVNESLQMIQDEKAAQESKA